MFVNTLQSAKATPWLATSWKWGNGNKTLTFTIRNGVKWSDGKPMTAADVTFSFNLLKKFKALDVNSVWSVLSSVTQKGADQVVMTFKAPAVTYFYYIGDQIGIVPQHIWSGISDPVKYPDTHPVGTGAFTVSPCTPQNITYKANLHYWQPGEPKLKTVNYPAFTTNDTANTYLANGQAQWGSQFIPSIQKFYVSKSPGYHYWFPPVANVSMFINLKKPVLNNVAVRQAMAYAINRQRAATIGEYGYQPASNQAGIVTPTFSSWLDSSQAAGFGNNYAYNPAKAIATLTAAGFKKGSDGIMAKGGQKLSFSIINNGGFSDWVAAVNVLQANLKAVGIQLTPKNLAAPAYQAALYNGNYELGYGSETGGPTPYYELRQWLFSGNSAPIGSRIELGALQQPGHGHADQLLQRHDQCRYAARHRQQAAGCDAEGGAGDPDHRAGRLVPVRHGHLHRMGHSGQPVRPAGRLQLPGLGPDAPPPGSEEVAGDGPGASRRAGAPGPRPAQASTRASG